MDRYSLTLFFLLMSAGLGVVYLYMFHTGRVKMRDRWSDLSPGAFWCAIGTLFFLALFLVSTFLNVVVP